jgi:hypothetical protein
VTVTKRKATKKKSAMKITSKKSKDLMKDFHAVIDKHGLPSGIRLAFATSNRASRSTCRCADGRPGVLRVVGDRLVCDCG